MGLQSTKCERCGGKEHATDSCPHEFFSTKCEKCGSVDHGTDRCPRGLFSTECGRCGSKEHATDDCPHEFFSTKCEKCGSVDHASGDCPRGFFSTACERCGSKNHNLETCPHRLGASTRAASAERSTDEEPSASSDTGCAQVVGWLVGVGIAMALALWLAVNIVLPVLLLNSAVILTVLALFRKSQRIPLASLALVGGSYMLLDIGNGWFSANFVKNVVGDPAWIIAIVWLNAFGAGLSTCLLTQPLWSRATTLRETGERDMQQRAIGLFALSGALIVGTTALLPWIYYKVAKSQLRPQKPVAPYALEGTQPNVSPGPPSKASGKTKEVAPPVTASKKLPTPESPESDKGDTTLAIVPQKESGGPGQLTFSNSSGTLLSFDKPTQKGLITVNNTSYDLTTCSSEGSASVGSYKLSGKGIVITAPNCKYGDEGGDCFHGKCQTIVVTLDGRSTTISNVGVMDCLSFSLD